MKDIVYALTLGMNIVLSFVFGIGFGYLLDNKFKFEGMGMVIGVLVGVLMAFGSLFRMMRKDNDG